MNPQIHPSDTPEARDYRRRSAIIKLKALRGHYADLGQLVSVERGSKDGREWENGRFQDETDALFHRLWFLIDYLPE